MHRIAKQIYTQIQQANHILLVPHMNPDWDALGSLTAFSHFLRTLGKNHTLFCATEIPENLKILPYTEHIKTINLPYNQYDLIIVLDSGDIRRAGLDVYVSQEENNPIIINIDHHSTNENFGVHNMVMENSSSTAEVLYHFFRHNELPIDATISTCLLAGLITDTDFFTNCATNVKSLEITSELVSAGGNLKLIKESIFKNKTIGLLKIYGVILSRLKKHKELNLIYTYITQDDLQKYSVPDSAMDEVTNFMNNINDVQVCAIFKELPEGKTKCSFRTTTADVDVGVIAKEFGGGGHKKAAGATINHPLQTAAHLVFNKMKEYDILKNVKE